MNSVLLQPDPAQNEPFLPIMGRPEPENQSQSRRPSKRLAAIISASTLFLLTLVALTVNNTGNYLVRIPDGGSLSSEGVFPTRVVSRGKSQGVSEKLSGGNKIGKSYPWTNDMLLWQRTGYHFQPQMNWMNDPDGPLYHMGYYHLFYQYNPKSAVWGNITWGHAISTDMINWKYLPISMIPDHWFDINGVWTGSATILPDGNIMMVYTGDTHKCEQVQNLAYPANISDPLLLDWDKYSGNPVMTPPKGIGSKDFRDPTTAWMGPDGVWRLVIGSKVNTTGVTLVYKTTNFTSYELVGNMHGVAGTGMWECVDFYPISTISPNGLDTSSYDEPGVKHVLKVSLDDTREDHYAIGKYDMETETWVPDNLKMDVGLGLRLDYGKYYASKSFYDPIKGRRIVWGWVGECDSEEDDKLKGWASLQAIPRVVTFDEKTGSNIIQWPIEEVESLRTTNVDFDNVILAPGSIFNLNITAASQVDILVEFKVNLETIQAGVVGNEVIKGCSTASMRHALGPFGVLVLADESHSELTPIYFDSAKASNETLQHLFCTDRSRSTIVNGLDNKSYGGPVSVLDGENYKMRILVDHSIIEAYGQGGRTCITSRVYPTKAINDAAQIFLFNNATDLSVTATAKIWNMKSADIRDFNFDLLHSS